jgi:hypothetical protein
MRGINPRALAVLITLLLSGSLSTSATHAETLATVNGSEISAEQVDRVLMRGHNSSAMEELAASGVRDFLYKAIDD